MDREVVMGIAKNARSLIDKYTFVFLASLLCRQCDKFQEMGTHDLALQRLRHAQYGRVKSFQDFVARLWIKGP
jgi:hypothetical protein